MKPVDPALLLAIGPALLLALGCVPSAWANRHVRWMTRGSVAAAWIGLISSILAAGVLLLPMGLKQSSTTELGLQISPWLHLDSLSAVMSLLISFIGLVVIRYSVRYLEGQATQGRFMRWMSFTCGAAMGMVSAGHLLVFFGAWILTSFGLHWLLVHYRERSGGHLAAHKKFVISRLGDAFILTAIVLTYLQFGVLDYESIFQAAEAIHLGQADGSWLASLAAICLVLGAMTKSAQFPMHTWLPDTMETPTPVSALMHAGIINAGGFLVVRLSPLVSLSPLALQLLMLVGGFTAIFAGIVMMPQPSIKRALAYSTIAQMGFMMLQCGLGAFSAALLHIVAHSLYKAHAFLSAGSVLERAVETSTSAGTKPSWSRSFSTLILAVVSATGLIITSLFVFGLSDKLYGQNVLLVTVMLLALAQLLQSTALAGQPGLLWRGLLRAAFVSIAYLGAYLVFHQITEASLSGVWQRTPSVWDWTLVGLFAAGFLSVLLLQAAWPFIQGGRWAQRLYVYALNGFYVDLYAARIMTRLWPGFVQIA